MCLLIYINIDVNVRIWERFSLEVSENLQKTQTPFSKRYSLRWCFNDVGGGDAHQTIQWVLFTRARGQGHCGRDHSYYYFIVEYRWSVRLSPVLRSRFKTVHCLSETWGRVRGNETNYWCPMKHHYNLKQTETLKKYFMIFQVQMFLWSDLPLQCSEMCLGQTFSRYWHEREIMKVHQSSAEKNIKKI